MSRLRRTVPRYGPTAWLLLKLRNAYRLTEHERRLVQTVTGGWTR